MSIFNDEDRCSYCGLPLAVDKTFSGETIHPACLDLLEEEMEDEFYNDDEHWYDEDDDDWYDEDEDADFEYDEEYEEDEDE